jgi:hypothetical protein
MKRIYRGFQITKGRTFQDYCVNLNGRTRWGTLAEVQADVDAYLSDSLPEPKRGWA